MPWSDERYPVSTKNLAPRARRKAIDVERLWQAAAGGAHGDQPGHAGGARENEHAAHVH